MQEVEESAIISLELFIVSRMPIAQAKHISVTSYSGFSHI